MDSSTASRGPAWRDRVGWLVFALCLFVYLLTLAPGTVFGDPSEYQFIPAVWGIAHPPGYAFYTLLAGAWQRVVRIGSVAYRTNLLAAAVGAWTASRVAAVVTTVATWQRHAGPEGPVTRAPAPETGVPLRSGDRPRRTLERVLPLVAALVAGLATGLAPDLWQHSIHANAHVVSAALTVTHLWLLVSWWRSERRVWAGGPGGRPARSDGAAGRAHDWRLYLLAFLVGVGVTHHPITVFGLPAYLAFILLCRPRIVLDLRTVLLGVVSGFAGLLPWLYFPLRSPNVPFGPTDMDTWDGFLRHATAQGLRVNLFHFGWRDQPDRLQVFASLANLQVGWVLLGVALVGLVWLLATHPRLGVLWALFLAGHLAFTLNSVQDVMAYLLHAFVAMGALVGFGVVATVRALKGRPALRGTGRSGRPPLFGPVSHRAPALGPTVMLAALAIVLARAAATMPRISLRHWEDADASIAALHERFDGAGEGATFVSDWEHLTPFYYYTLVEGWTFEATDLDTIYVTGETPWVDSVFGSLAEGPVYLSTYRRDVRELGFRLRPVGDLWRVLEPGPMDAPPPGGTSVLPVAPQVSGVPACVGEPVGVGDLLELLGYDLPVTQVAQGGRVPLTLYARATMQAREIVMPVAWLGDVEQRWTTDSRRLTPYWRPGEIIVERYELAVPYGMAPGEHPLDLAFERLGDNRGLLALSCGGDRANLGTVQVVRPGEASDAAPALAPRRAQRLVDRALTTMGNEVALTSATARSGVRWRAALWERPLPVRAGSPLHLRLRWQVLARPGTSYTVFIHLVDGAGALAFGHDYTPLGGAFPSYLWFPKWLAGQRVVDPYTLVLPPDLAPGSYQLEVGLYEMGSVRRIPQYSADGTLTGDRLILGRILVE